MLVKAGKNPDPAILYELIVLVRKLGLKTLQFKKLCRLSQDRLMTLEALLKARKPTQFRYNDDVFESIVDRVAAYFGSDIRLGAQAPSNNINRSETKLKPRCGFTQVRVQRRDRHLFIDGLQPNRMDGLQPNRMEPCKKSMKYL